MKVRSRDIMHDDGQLEEGLGNLLDLNEIMHAFGVAEWSNLGPVTSPHTSLFSLPVEIAGQRYILKERSEGLAEEDSQHRYRFQNFLRQSGIPVPPFWLTPQGEPVVSIGDDSFELQQWFDGESFNTADPRSLAWVAVSGSMLDRILQSLLTCRGPEHGWP